MANAMAKIIINSNIIIDRITKRGILTFKKNKKTKENQNNTQQNEVYEPISKSSLELIIQGTALGDIAGALFEGHDSIPNWYSDKFASDILYMERMSFTDDTILSVATIDALQNKKSFGETYAQYCIKYPSSYGTNFINWALSDKKEPYNSCGNGSAMRVSPVAAFVTSIEECERLAKESAMPTHNHPEGVKGAVVTAHMVYMALHGESKEAIIEYGISQYPETVKRLKSRNKKPVERENEFYILCQDIMPLVIASFANTNDFETCIYDAICQGGDTDTQAAIAGAIAGAYYKSFSKESEDKWNKVKSSKIFHNIQF